MKEKNTLIKIFGGAIALAAVFALSTNAASAYRGDPAVQGPNYSVERHDTMIHAFDTRDYDEWSNLMSGKGRVLDIINKDNFNDFVKIHDLMLNGDKDEALELRTELGLGLMNGSSQGRGQGLRDGSGRGQFNK